MAHVKPGEEEIVFFEVDPKKHAIARIGVTSIKSGGKLIVYVGPDGPLDRTFRERWLQHEAQKKKPE
ncbi:MAG TPA: hypothetical protein VF980_04500 [Thermoanaerobaculia bacterium]